MITFRQKEFTEYDAMKAFHNELCRLTDRNRFPICTKSEMIPILKGNNIIIEKFVIASPFFGRDVYRMYIRVGLKAKMPEAIKLTDKQYDKRLGDFQLNFKSGNLFDDPKKNFEEERTMSDLAQKIFGNNNNKNKYPSWKPQLSSEFHADRNAMSISYLAKETLGEAIVNDKKTRTVVLEFKSIHDAIRVLNILPFGLNYRIYLLDA
jgi:hypothetical protein